MTLENRSLERIAREFPGSEQAAAIDVLCAYAGPEKDRVIWDILELSKASLDNVKKFTLVAQTDYRDVLYWAEYYVNDPLLRGRDPEKLVQDILAKWGPPK